MTLSKSEARILQLLQADGRMTNVALSERIGMAPSPCLRRVKALEDAGIIQGYRATLDRAKIGIGIMAFAEVKVPQIPGREMAAEFRKAVQSEPWILECFITAGQFDFLLRVAARDMDHYSRLAQESLLRLPGVQDMRTTFVLETIKSDAALPVT